MDKDHVAEILIEIGTLLELKGENPFKTRAYLNAARAIESCNESLDKLVAEDRLGEIKGVGEAIQKKIAELVTTGKLAYYEELKASVPPGLIEMLEIPGVGPKKIKVLHQELGIESVRSAGSACQDGRVAKLADLARRRRQNICEGINRRRTYASQTSFERRAARCRTDSRQLAPASGSDPLQHGWQPAAETRKSSATLTCCVPQNARRK